jgi:hypothetical protein
MHHHNQFVQCVELSIRLDHFLKNARYNISGYPIFPSKTKSYWFVILILLIVNNDPNHVAIPYVP